MHTVVETSLFQKQWPMYWTEDERGEFAAGLALAPEAGVVVKILVAFERFAGSEKAPGNPVV